MHADIKFALLRIVIIHDAISDFSLCVVETSSWNIVTVVPPLCSTSATRFTTLRASSTSSMYPLAPRMYLPWPDEIMMLVIACPPKVHARCRNHSSPRCIAIGGVDHAIDILAEVNMAAPK